MATLGFVGVGTINSAIVTGICEAESFEGVRFPLYLSPRGAAKGRALKEKYGDKVEICRDNEEVVSKSTVVFLGVTPPVAPDVVPQLATAATEAHLVVNLLSTLAIEACAEMLGGKPTVVKAVPLPSVASRNGTTVVCPPNPQIQQIFAQLGSAVAVDDQAQLRAMQTVTCEMGPLYATFEAFHEWMQSKGVPPASSAKYIGSLFHGITHESARLGAQTPDAFRHLVAEQTPGGLNESAIKQLKEQGVFETHKAVLDNILARFEAKK
ncbi:hypothetical protein DIPPA_15573 [Diplonema papillatum]|nr:hypothetical protein DIPPA_15573 [Diplonema papillatum]